MILSSFKQALMITGFVFVMMLVIEYLNVLSRGLWQHDMRSRRWSQYLLAALLGVTPGCLGAFAVVSLYVHRIVSPGAVVAAMIATSGDESFVLLTMSPQTALLIFVALFVLGVAAGYATDRLPKRFFGHGAEASCDLKIHEQDSCDCFPRDRIIPQLRSCSLARGVLLLATISFLFALIQGYVGPEVWDWLRWALLLTTGIGLFIVATVPEHFLESHLWEHVFLTHIPRIFLWTFGALWVMNLLLKAFDLGDWLHVNGWLMLLAACLLGLIPESGPHLIFLTLYTQGVVPLSVLLASSIVQDGHGMLPLLSASRSDFFKIKGLNFMVGLLVGLTGKYFGW